MDVAEDAASEQVRGAASETKAGLTFALVSPCGYGNLGDAAIQDAVIANIRRRFPDAIFYGITLKPKDTVERHGIPAFPIAGVPRPFYTAVSIKDDASPGSERQAAEKARHWHSIGKSLSSISIRIARFLLSRGWPWIIMPEMTHILKGFAFLKNVDLVIFSGGGQLDDYWGGAWGHPYALLKWAILGRLRGARPIFLSVGFGTLDSRLSRLFTRAALSLAAYRSYRDSGSRDLMQKAGFGRDDPVFPDLAYSLPLHGDHRPRDPHHDGRIVGLCPFSYCDPHSWPRKDLSVYDSYLRNLCIIVKWLVTRKCRVAIFTSDISDRTAIDDLFGRLSSEMTPEELRYVDRHYVETVRGFLDHASCVDLVVASRLHSVLLAQLVGTPVLAISFDRKVDVQMESMGQSLFRLPIDNFEMSTFQDRFVRLEAYLETAREQIRARVPENRVQLEAQYDAILPKHA